MKIKNYFEALLIAATLASGAALVGCDRATVETTRVRETPDGTKVEKTTVTEHNDGTVSKESTERTIQH